MKKTLKKIILLGACVLMGFVCGPLFAQELNPQIQKGIDCHDRARSGDPKNTISLIEECLKTLEPFTQTNAIACAVYGSALTIKASIVVETNAIKSLEYLDKGNGFIDKAVLMNPNEIYCRMLRLENGIEVSRTSPLKRYSEIKSDVEFLIDDEKVEELSGKDKAEAYLYCGFYYLDSGDLDYALELFELAQEAAPDSDSGKRAQKMLDKYSE